MNNRESLDRFGTIAFGTEFMHQMIVFDRINRSLELVEWLNLVPKENIFRDRILPNRSLAEHACKMVAKEFLDHNPILCEASKSQFIAMIQQKLFSYPARA
jgi:hypothetical protein